MLWILFLKAEKYGQFADNTAGVSTQEREKQKGVEKRQIRETKYYRQGMVIPWLPIILQLDQWPQFRPKQKKQIYNKLLRLRDASLSVLTKG